jgi:GrpB-like predicted nucleotidyltransferase (UPF0157 family)
VHLAEHDPAWSDQFKRAAALIIAATDIAEERVQHVGSTSVPDLVAKPILDINVGILPSDDIEVVVARLVDLGYIDRGEGDGGIGRLLVWESAPDVRTTHLHLQPFDSKWWRGDLTFRNALRADPELRRRYGRLKSSLAHQFSDDRRAYRHAKNEFFRNEELAFGS